MRIHTGSTWIVISNDPYVEQIASEHEDVLSTPKPEVVFEDFGDSSLVFDIYFWIDMSEGRSLRRARSELRFQIAKVLEENGIVIAFPQRDVHIDGSIEISRSRGKEAHTISMKILSTSL